MKRDQGFTLTELIVAVAIVAIISTSIGAALITGMRITSNTYSKFDQSNAELAVTRFLSGDIYAAEGPIVYNSSSDVTCGGVANPGLKLKSRTDATAGLSGTNITTVVWALSGTDLMRRTCVNGVQTDSFRVAGGISAFTPTGCSNPCTNLTLTVTFKAAAVGTNGKVPEQSWTLKVTRRGVTS